MTNNDPFALLALPDAEWPANADPVADAVRCFDPSQPEPLTKLLESHDLGISRLGLRVFGELGRKGAIVLNTALKLHNHPHDMARNALMDGVICYSSSLDADQAAVVFHLITDPFDLVRFKSIIFLAYADLEALERAIGLLSEPTRSQHREGLGILPAEHFDTQELFDKAIVRTDIWSAYALASLVRRAKKDTAMHPPEYGGESYVGNSAIAHIKMLITRRHNKRTRKDIQ